MKESVISTIAPTLWQREFISNGWIDITPDGVEADLWWSPGELNNRMFERVPIFKAVEKANDNYFAIVLTDAGRECEFYKFVVRTAFSKGEPISGPVGEYLETMRTVPIMARLTAIGYLLCRVPCPDKYAVVASNHCAQYNFIRQCGGKTLFGKALGYISPQLGCGNWGAFLNEAQRGVNFNKVQTIHLYNVSPNTYFLRDVLKASEQGLEADDKNGLARRVSTEDFPKVYATARDVLNIPSREMRRFIKVLSFWDYYNASHTPEQDFGHKLFDDWDYSQWVLFENFMYECIWLYLKSIARGWTPDGSGIVEDYVYNIGEFYRAHNHPNIKTPRPLDF